MLFQRQLLVFSWSGMWLFVAR